jgi:NAD(P)-dependent dehydrogenase (short-subunit alcohol dehydrogenase family)
MENKDKVALVTGGLTGIGKAAVMELAKKGYTIIIFGRSDAKAPAVIKEAESYGGKAFFKHCDVTDSQQVKEGFAWIKDTFGALHCAFNNAGQGLHARPFHQFSEADIDFQLQLLVKAQMMCLREEIPFMLEQNYGRIVNTSSGAGLVGSKGGALYNACKHAVVGLTKGTALDYAQNGITVNAICPGSIETELISTLRENPTMWERVCSSNPIGRLGQPWEIGRVVSFLFEDDSEFINGAIIPVDSGYCAGTFK